MIVVDASALIEVLIRSQAASSLEHRLFSESLNAPHLIDVEITHVVRRLVAINQIDEARARSALAALVDIPLRRYPQTRLVPRIWDLRRNLTPYDAAYVSLAEALGAPLVTRDARLAGAVGHRAQIELV